MAKKKCVLSPCSCSAYKTISNQNDEIARHRDEKDQLRQLLRVSQDALGQQGNKLREFEFALKKAEESAALNWRLLNEEKQQSALLGKEIARCKTLIVGLELRFCEINARC